MPRSEAVNPEYLNIFRPTMHRSMTTALEEQRRQELARKVVRDAAIRTAFASKLARRPQMKGGLGRNLFARNDEGRHATDPVSLNRIPVSRAVKVGRQHYDSRTLQRLFKINPRATNPLTRQPFPQNVYAKYGRPESRARRARRALSLNTVEPWDERYNRQLQNPLLARRAWAMAMQVARYFQTSSPAQADVGEYQIPWLAFDRNFLTRLRRRHPRESLTFDHGLVDPDERGTAWLEVEYKSLDHQSNATAEYAVLFEHRFPFDGKLRIQLLENGHIVVTKNARLGARGARH